MSKRHQRMIHYGLEHLAFLDGQLLVLDEEILLEIDKAGFCPALELKAKSVPSSPSLTTYSFSSSMY
jgi:hypothetical protein